MANLDWRNLELAEGVLREPTPDEHRLVLWLRGDAAGGYRQWQRVSTVQGADVTLEHGFFRTPATMILARQKMRGLLGKILNLFRRPRGERLWVLPTGGVAEQMGERVNDLLLVWTEQEGLDSHAVQERWQLRKLAENLFLATRTEVALEASETFVAQDVKPLDQAKELLAAAKKAGDCPRQASALVDLGVIHLREGQVPLAVQLLGKALTIARKFADLPLASDAQTNLAMAFLSAGQPEKARQLLEEERVEARKTGDRFQEKLLLGHLGVVHAKMHDHATAIRFYEQALNLARQVGDRRQQADLLWHLAIQNAELGERDQALTHGQAAIALMRDMGNPKVVEYAKFLEKYHRDEADSRLEPEPVSSGPLPGGYYQPVVIGAGTAPPLVRQKETHGPGLLRMALSAAKAMASFIGSGMKRVPPKIYEKRLETCATCPHHSGVRCKLCGCFTSVKAWLPHETCPVGSWPT